MDRAQLMPKLTVSAVARRCNAAVMLLRLLNAGYRLEDVSAATGIPFSTLRRWCVGTRFPRAAALERLIKFYNARGV